MKFLKYRGYIGRIRYSHEDKVFWGKLETDEGLITFEAENARNFEISFQDAVNSYLEDCRQLGIEPRKTILKADDFDESDIRNENVELVEIA